MFLNTSHHLLRKYTPLYIGAFFLLRIISFFLREHLIIQGCIAAGLMILLAVLYFHSPKKAFFLIVLEIFLGGSGHLFELGGLAIRTIFIYTFLSLTLFDALLMKKHYTTLFIKKNINFAVFPLLIFATLGMATGFFEGHTTRAIIGEFIPYSFLLLIFPAYQFIDPHTHSKKQYQYLDVIIASIFATTLFSLILFTAFSMGIEELQSPLYKWLRDVMGGKFTNLGQGFWRIVFPYHLLFPVYSLLIASLLMHKQHWKTSEKRVLTILLLCCLTVLVINFSRAYILGTIVGGLILLYKQRLKQWIPVVLLSSLSFIGIFFFLSFMASGGHSIGLEILGLRAGSFVNPESELSAHTRMQLLTPIFSSIQSHPMLGVGLGSLVEVVNPANNELIRTPHYDWGYFEVFAELGALGFTSLIFFLAVLFFKLKSHIHRFHKKQAFHSGLLAAYSALLVIAIFSPVFGHVFGMFFLVFLSSVKIREHFAIL